MSRSVKPLPKWLMLFVRLNWCISAFALSFPLGLLATTCVMRFVLSVICSYHFVSLWLPVYLCDSCFILSNLTRFYLYRTWRTESEEWWEGGKWKGERRSRRWVPPSWNHPCLALPSTTHLSLILGTLRSEDGDGIVNVSYKWICVLSIFMPIIPSHLPCEMLANSPAVEFLRTIFKTKNGEKNFVVACSRPPLNVKQGIFTS